jgi:predicted TIM-barrel fold metal-dependent hydrolase
MKARLALSRRITIRYSLAMPRAIDTHVHVGMIESHPKALTDELERYFRTDLHAVTDESTAELYRRLDVLAVIFMIDFESASGFPYPGNEKIAETVRHYPDIFVGFASVDPWKGEAAIRELERSVRELGLRGLKLHPGLQRFTPNERRFGPLWAKCNELRLPVVVHTGHTGVGAGLPGGGGVELKHCRPIYLDEIAAEFPDLTLIMAHPAWPWHEEQLSVAMHKPNVYIDLSGWSPKYFPPSVVQYANTLLQDKFVFGSDYPVISPERWLRDFEAAAFKDEVRPKILLENARRALGLT